MVPETRTASPGLRPMRPDGDARAQHADARRIDVAAVAVSALHHLGVASDDLHARRGRGRSHGLRQSRQVGQRKSFFQDEAGAEELGIGAGDGEIVDRAIHGQRADRSTGKKQRLHHKGIGAHGEAA